MRSVSASTRPRLTLFSLVAATYFMVCGGPYGIEDILGGAGYRDALLILLLVPLVWSLPTALMIGELASALPCEGGFYVWVRRALGPFWGYQEAWLSLAASIFDMAIYPTLFALYLGRLAPAITAGWRGPAWELAVVIACCAWNLRGARAVGRGAIFLFGALLLPFAVLVVCALCHRIPGASAVWHARPAGGTSFSVAVLVALWNYMGWDNASTVAQEVERPAATYPAAMLMATALVALSYVLPLGAIAYAGVPLDRFTTGAWVDAARTLAGPWLALAVTVGGVLSALGMFNALVLSYTRLPMVLAEEGMLPAPIARSNRLGAPVAATLLCGVAWALALSLNYERLISIDLILYGSSLILEFVALLVLRMREPGLRRPFRAGPLPFASLLAVMPTVLIVYAIWISRGERMAGMPAPAFGLLVAAAGALAYTVTSRRRRT